MIKYGTEFSDDCLFSVPSDSVKIFLPFATSVEGFVMDKFCIDRGTLLDKPNLASLQFPHEHSLHWYVLYMQPFGR